MGRFVRFMSPLLLAVGVAGCGGSTSSGPGEPPPPPPLNSGLDARPANLSCVAPPRPAQDAQIAFERVFANLPFTQPLGMRQAPGDDSRWYVMERAGRIRAFANDPDVTAFDQPDFIQLAVETSFLESGLHGMAFHPDYQNNGEVFLAWVEGANAPQSVIARFRTLDGGLTLDPGTQEDILRIDQDGLGHNGGHIQFGPDGYLYVGLGDGDFGSPGDPLNRSQDTTNLLGAMLRIDVDGPPAAGAAYGIPPDNPFSANPVCAGNHSSVTDCPEIHAWGLRNPWQWNFDTVTGRLWLGDVGQFDWEEVNLIERGGNYGWNCREGANPYRFAPPSCALRDDLIDPVHDYSHTGANGSVTAGFVYRGSEMPELIGQFLFADFMTGEVWRLLDDGQGGYEAELLADTDFWISAFGQDLDGELYVLQYGGFGPGANGEIYRMVRAGEAPGLEAGPPLPAQLSLTGCVAEQDAAQPASGLIPYHVAAGAWFDGAVQERWLAIPDGTVIDVDSEDHLVWPLGTVLMEHLRLGDALVETRLLMRHPDGIWGGYSYAWDETGTDAMLVTGGAVSDVNGQDWVFPDSAQCMSCHRGSAGYALGTGLAQLNRDFTYAATGRTENQLTTLSAIGMTASPLSDPGVLPALADPADDSASLADRARAYLHANCAHCHGTVAIAGLDLRHTTLMENTGACDAVPQRGDLDIVNARVIAPGDPERSVLLARMDSRDTHAMPPLATLRVDEAGVTLVTHWISAMSATCQ
jgi:uncharacterized repeat protein (TIGR03806 family)